MNTIKTPVSVNMLPGVLCAVVDRLGNTVCQCPSDFANAIAEAINKEAEHEDETEKLKNDVKRLEGDCHSEQDESYRLSSNIDRLEREIDRITAKLAKIK